MSFILPACARLPMRFDSIALGAAVAALPPEAWQPHFNTGYYEGDWSGIALRAYEDASTPLAPGQGETRATAYCDEFWQAQLARLKVGLCSVRLLRLGPGGSIREHRDYDLGAPDGNLRLHVPIVTDAQVDFLLDGRKVPMQVGECWFLDLSRPHRVENHGGSSRIHLVIDCCRGSWLEAQIVTGLVDTPASRPSRGSEAFAAFSAHMHADPTLQAELAAHEDSATFTAAVLALAATRGYRFSDSDLRAAMSRGRSDWSTQWRV